jgi:hypothetical protein
MEQNLTQKRKYQKRNGKINRTERVNLSFTPYQYAILKETANDNNMEMSNVVLTAFNLSVSVAQVYSYFNKIIQRNPEAKEYFNNLFREFFDENPHLISDALELHKDLNIFSEMNQKWDKWSKKR